MEFSVNNGMAAQITKHFPIDEAVYELFRTPPVWRPCARPCRRSPIRMQPNGSRILYCNGMNHQTHAERHAFLSPGRLQHGGKDMFHQRDQLIFRQRLRFRDPPFGIPTTPVAIKRAT